MTMRTDDSPLVEPEWLAMHLDDPDVRVVDCRFSLMEPEAGRQQYAASHIPGAVYAHLDEDLAGPTGPDTGRHPLPDAEAFGRRLAAWGINSEDTGHPTFVVAYDDARLAFAARLWWLLRYFGHRHVAVLNGGWSAWCDAGLPVGSEVPQPRPGRFTPHPQPDQAVDFETVAGLIGRPEVTLIDSRSPERHQGRNEPIDPVAGTIPGAVNYFSNNVVDDDGRMKAPEQLAEYWRSLDDAEETVAFCGSGVTACVNVLSQEVAGRSPSRLYVGGWSEWCRRGDT